MDTPFVLTFQSLASPWHLHVLLALRGLLLLLALLAWVRVRSAAFGLFFGWAAGLFGASLWLFLAVDATKPPTALPAGIPPELLSPVALETAAWGLMYLGFFALFGAALRGRLRRVVPDALWDDDDAPAPVVSAVRSAAVGGAGGASASRSAGGPGAGGGAKVPPPPPGKAAPPPAVPSPYLGKPSGQTGD